MAGLIPAEIDPRVINLALSGGSAMEAYFMARRILRQPEKPAMVLLSIGPSHLAFIDFWERGGSFGFLTSSEMREVARKGRELRDSNLASHWPFSLDTQLEALLLPRHFPSYYITALRQSRMGRRGPENRRACEGVLAQRGFCSYGNQPGSWNSDMETSLTQWKLSPVADYYLHALLTLLAERHVPVYLVCAPLNEASVRRYHPALTDGLTRYWDQGAGRVPGTPLSRTGAGLRASRGIQRFLRT